MALNKYLILCLVLVQPDFMINKVLNIIIIVWVRGGAIECGCLGHFRLSLRFRLNRNILRKEGKLYFCVDACVYVMGCSLICIVEGEVIST